MTNKTMTQEEIDAVVRSVYEHFENPEEGDEGLLSRIHKSTNGKFGEPKLNGISQGIRSIVGNMASGIMKRQGTSPVNYDPKGIDNYLETLKGKPLTKAQVREIENSPVSGFLMDDQRVALSYLPKLERFENLKIVGAHILGKNYHNGDSEVGNAVRDYINLQLQANYTPGNPLRHHVNCDHEYGKTATIKGDFSDYVGYHGAVNDEGISRWSNERPLRIFRGPDADSVRPYFLGEDNGNGFFVGYCKTRRALRDWIFLIGLDVTIDSPKNN